MTSLQLGLFAAGGVLVVGVLVYNWLAGAAGATPHQGGFLESRRRHIRLRRIRRESGARVEPSLASAGCCRKRAARASVEASDDGGYEPPLEVHARIASEVAGDEFVPPMPLAARGKPEVRRRPTSAAARSRHRVHREPAAGATHRGGRARRRTACSTGSAVALVRPPWSRPALAIAEIGHRGRVLRDRRVPSSRQSLRCGDGADARSFRARRHRCRGGAACGPERAGHRRRRGARGGRRSHLCRSRRANRDHAAQDRRRPDRRHAASRHCRGVRIPPCERRALRLDPGGDGIGALCAAKLQLRSLYGGHAARVVDAGCRLPARRPRVAEPVTRVRSDEARREEHGAKARRGVGRRQPASARRCRIRGDPRPGAQHRCSAARGQHRAGQPACTGAVRG